MASAASSPAMATRAAASPVDSSRPSAATAEQSRRVERKGLEREGREGNDERQPAETESGRRVEPPTGRAALDVDEERGEQQRHRIERVALQRPLRLAGGDQPCLERHGGEQNQGHDPEGGLGATPRPDDRVAEAEHCAWDDEHPGRERKQGGGPAAPTERLERRVVQLAGAAVETEQRAAPHHSAHGEERERRQCERMPPNGPADEQHGQHERERKDEELGAGQDCGSQDEHGERVPAKGRLGDGADRDEHRKQEDRQGQGLGGQVRVVEHRAAGDRGGCHAECVRGTDDEAGERPGRKHGGAHEDGVERLRGTEGGGSVKEPDGRLHQRGQDRREQEALAAHGQAVARREASSELGEHQLVGEDGGSRVAERLGPVVEGGDAEETEQREQPSLPAVAAPGSRGRGQNSRTLERLDAHTRSVGSAAGARLGSAAHAIGVTSGSLAWALTTRVPTNPRTLER